MNTAEFKTASARPGDPVHSIMEGISHSSIMAVVKTTNQHPMSAAVSLITCHLATLHACDKAAVADLLKHFVAIEEMDDADPATFEEIKKTRSEIIMRLISIYERQLAEIQGMGRA